ncbi:hypothetical protein IMG5_199990 [Ichthyophthirius multifiliis]|uniref:CFA20 domain-containing protein n=1 Tax=Ichthyophthirius multifiliis TaxID=5932 RepID=G0R5P0_ICHMU|nr:hypothetical protein IMG5_199990 [Ichthyophthirius multifiliis]EGR27213.1 hypothetical protein IMG5_199990 [Ichthyophthirius multifiliis]|eukprot:XP_004024097.1 hypothetical protein IMG5_199990 [Ichthyophthirius multifiliis]
MFSESLQVGVISVLYSIGSKPLQIWDQKCQNGHIKVVKDEDLLSQVIEIYGTNITTNYIIAPNQNQTFGLKTPFLHILVKNVNFFIFFQNKNKKKLKKKMKQDFSFEIRILDDKKEKRRFKFSNFQKNTIVKSTIVNAKLKMNDGWNHFVFNIQNINQKSYGTNLKEVTHLIFNANCRLRRVYFTDKLYNPKKEIGGDLRIFLRGKSVYFYILILLEIFNQNKKSLIKKKKRKKNKKNRKKIKKKKKKIDQKKKKIYIFQIILTYHILIQFLFFHIFMYQYFFIYLFQFLFLYIANPFQANSFSHCFDSPSYKIFNLAFLDILSSLRAYFISSSIIFLLYLFLFEASYLTLLSCQLVIRDTLSNFLAYCSDNWYQSFFFIVLQILIIFFFCNYFFILFLKKIIYQLKIYFNISFQLKNTLFFFLLQKKIKKKLQQFFKTNCNNKKYIHQNNYQLFINILKKTAKSIKNKKPYIND